MDTNIKNASNENDDVFFVYFARTENNGLYIGQTDNLDRREFEHQCHVHGAKFFKDNGKNFQIVYTEQFSTRTEAMKREKQLKGWTRAKKEALVAGDFELLKRL